MSPNCNNSRPAASGTWSVTFADLLTLLLCFFIATVGGRPLPVALPPASVTAAPGTSIALSASELSPSSWKFTRADLNQDQTGLNAAGLERVVNFVSSPRYEQQQLVVTSCSPTGSRAEVVARLTGVRSQFLDAGVSPSAVVVQVGDGQCEREPANWLVSVELQESVTTERTSE